jgi:hypothetical protein
MLKRLRLLLPQRPLFLKAERPTVDEQPLLHGLLLLALVLAPIFKPIGCVRWLQRNNEGVVVTTQVVLR